jgi:hypothetical protein
MTPIDNKKGEPWLDDPDAPPTEEELRAIAGLEGELRGDDADFAEAVKSSHSPKALDELTHERILRRAVLPAATKRAPRLVVVAIAGSGFLAAAAAAVLILGPMKRSSEPVGASPAATAAPAIAMVPCRSAQDLFDEPFPREGGESARVDRIASAREHDLRQNRFASWGVR